MESRPDLIPPCCAACATAGVAAVRFYPDDDESEPFRGWYVKHGLQLRKIEHGAEALATLQALHYAPPEDAT